MTATAQDSSLAMTSPATRWRRVLGVVLPPVVALVLLVAAWQITVDLARIKPSWVPSPWIVLQAALERRADLLYALWCTAQAALIGFGLSLTVGIAAGVILSSTRLIERSFYPFTIFLQTVPLIAIAPLLVKWFGVGRQSVAIAAFIASVFPVIANTLLGLRSVDPALRDLFRLYGASWLETLFKLKIPSALPNIFTGLRIASGLAVIGAIVGEFSAATFDEGGLGLMVLSAKRYARTDLVFAAVVVSSLLGLALFALVNITAWLTLRHWHASAGRD